MPRGYSALASIFMRWLVESANYKNSRAYDYKYPEITAVREWHVGGHSADVVDRLLKMMTGRAKLIHRAG